MAEENLNLALPDEEIAELILWRLPVKSILECRCVCKSWYSLITSPNFISTHLRRKALTEIPQILIHERNANDKTGNYVLLFEDQDCFRSLLFGVPHLPPKHYIITVGSVNGLICLSIIDTDHVMVDVIIVFNPSIGHFLSIPAPPSSRGQVPFWDCSFGYDEFSQDYIILIVQFNSDVFIYSLNSHSWRSINYPASMNLQKVRGSAIFVNGKFHWVVREKATGSKFIVVFDMKGDDGAFGRISLPECLANMDHDERLIWFGESSIAVVSTIMEFGESSIAVVSTINYPLTDIWIMREYGSVESWIKLTLRNKQLKVFGFRSKDEVLFRCKSGCIASQKINKSAEIKNIMDVDSHKSFSFSMHKYVPSLVLLDKKNDIDVAAPTHGKRTKTAPTHKKSLSRKRIKTAPKLD